MGLHFLTPQDIKPHLGMPLYSRMLTIFGTQEKSLVNEKAELADYGLTSKAREDGLKLKSRLARLLRGPLALQRAPRVVDIRIATSGTNCV